MLKMTVTLAVSSLLLLVGGCTRYHVGVTTYLAKDVAFPRAYSETTIAVITDSDPDEPLLQREVKRKIEWLLQQQGYGIAELTQADYVLFAFFAIDAGHTEVGARPVTTGGGVSQTQVRTSTGQWATATTYHPSTTTYVPTSYTAYARYLGMKLYEVQRWLASEEEDRSDAIAWSSSTISNGQSGDLRRVVDYLLVATFEEFGEDTGKQKLRRLWGGDCRVEELRDRDSGDDKKEEPKEGE